MSGRLDDRVAFITGVARGQGRAHAVRLAEEGADIVGVDLRSPDDDPEFRETIALVESTGRRMIGRAADVRKLGELTSAADSGVSAFGRLDVVVANAGVLKTGALSSSEEDWRLAFDVNALGAWLTCKATVPHIVSGGRGGSVVIVSSIFGLKGQKGAVAYTASKHAATGLMRTLALELAPERIRVNSVHPTAVDTAMLRAAVPSGLSWEQFAETMRGLNALPVGCIEPEGVSAAVAFLASDDARYVTGVALPVDAGALAK